MNTSTEDFTFPVIITSNDVNVFPSLWRICSIDQSDNCAHNSEHQIGIIFRKRIFTSLPHLESDKNGKLDGGSKADEEKMDELWEDFNEELLQDGLGNNLETNFSDGSNCPLELSSNYSEICYSNGDDQSDDWFRDDFEEGLKMECGILKRKNLDLWGKMLKKLFLLQNIAAVKKKSS
ncbi:cysteine proteinases superfamily protein [Striga asiatica]|uniref:Cysteine proteinases superfamily protein n=1 Tax=Striga asiatica TaxID=4170 RepID=A0A5A7P639_STRAF|nr:cysteine proteinases superfamily protein [Striga asiatica]